MSANDAQTYWNTHSDAWDIWFEEWGSSGSGVVASFVYDGDGNRVQKTENGQTTLYLNKYVQKDIASGNMTSFYYLGGTLIAMKEGTSTVNYHHHDSLGGTIVMSNSTGGLIASVSYTPFGEVRNAQGTACSDKLFTGQRLDDTGLYYYGARFYDSYVGRFASTDTFGQNARNPQAANKYSYVFNNPLNHVDPTGLNTVSVGASFLAGAGAAVSTSGHVVLDDKGNWGFLISNGGGTAFGATLGGNVVYQWTNAPTISDLNGLGWQFEASFDVPGLSVDFAYIGGQGSSGNIYSGFNVGVGLGISLLGVTPNIIFTSSTVIPEGKINPFWYYVAIIPILPVISIFNFIPHPPPPSLP